jgi:hypothetical protein
MSLSIDCRCITAIYALGQWFEVVPDSLDVDAYELVNWRARAEVVKREGEDEIGYDLYTLGHLYPEGGGAVTRFPYAKVYQTTPSGNHGITFIEKKSKQRVSFCLLEVKAFKEDRSLINE